MIDSFFICLTRSGDGTHAKFDFTDPKQCDICQPFNPFAEEAVEGEELENDSERNSKSMEDEVEDKKPPEGETEEQKKEREEKEAAEKKKNSKLRFKMSRQEKLDKIVRKIKDWLPSCKKNLYLQPIADKTQIKFFKNDDDAEGIAVDDAYVLEEDGWRWNHSKCEMHFADGEEFVDSSRCL